MNGLGYTALVLGLEQVRQAAQLLKYTYLSYVLDVPITSLSLDTFTRAIKKGSTVSSSNWIEYLVFKEDKRAWSTAAAFFKKKILTFFISFFKDCHTIQLQRQSIYF